MVMITIDAAGAVLTMLAVFFGLLTLSLRTEKRHARSILGPPPGYLAAATRRVTGLYVRSPVFPCGPVCHCHPARAVFGADPSRG